MSMRTQNPCYSQGQHDALQRSTDRRKHLNYLLHDYSEENKRVYGDAMPTAGSLIRPITHKGDDASFRSAASGALQGAAAESRQLAAQVNNRRTQIGQFYTTVNPSLFERAAPPATYQGTNLTQTAVEHLAGSAGYAATGRIVDRSAVGSGGQQGTSPAHLPGDVSWGPSTTFPAAPEGGHPRGMGLTSSSLGGSGGGFSTAGGSGGGFGTTGGSYGTAGGRAGTAGLSGTTGGRPSWLLPWQTGDRQLGRAMAEAVRGKRTPIGAFAHHDLAKANK